MHSPCEKILLQIEHIQIWRERSKLECSREPTIFDNEYYQCAWEKSSYEWGERFAIVAPKICEIWQPLQIECALPNAPFAPPDTINDAIFAHDSVPRAWVFGPVDCVIRATDIDESTWLPCIFERIFTDELEHHVSLVLYQGCVRFEAGLSITFVTGYDTQDFDGMHFN